MGTRAGGAGFLQEEDLVRFNEWLWLTRLRSMVGVLVLTGIVDWILATPAVPIAPVAALCVADLLASVAYRRWLAKRQQLRVLAYVQLIGDTLVILIGLSFVRQAPLLFHFLLLLAVVPASMIEWKCGMTIATLATVGHYALIGWRGTADWTSVASVLPPATFYLIASQSMFYAQHLAQKNVDLEAAAESLNESNRRLEEEAAISAALLRAAQALTTSFDPREILERLNEVVRTALQCDFSTTLLYDEQTKVYRVASISGDRPEVLEEVRTVEFPVDSAEAFTAAVERGLVCIENRDSPLFPAALMERWGISSFMLADLRRGGKSIGLLSAGFNDRSAAFSPREVRMFRSIAQQAAVALDNARLVENLRGASRVKSEFIGTMSHELRSPLNVVIGYVDLLLAGDMGTLQDEQKDALERVQQHALQLLELIQETLDLNRMEAGLLPLDLEAFSVSEFIDEVKDSIPTDWYKLGVILRWEVAPTPIVIRTDRTKLKKIIRNLVHNALKFTERGAVSVTVQAENGGVDFAIADTGIGINPDALPVIFDMFRQVDGSTTRRHGGVGLGLYIVKQLARALGGDVSVTSAVGVGSTFHIRLRRGDVAKMSAA